MYQHPDGTTRFTLQCGREVGVAGSVIDVVRTGTTTEVRTRIPREVRDVVYCWDDHTGLPLWIGAVRFESAVPAVIPDRNTLRHPSRCDIVVPSSIVNFVELDPGEYVVCWDRPQDATEVNVRCFDVECKVKWTIGIAEGKPFGVYHGISLRPGNVLEAYGKSRGYLSVVDQETGKVIETRPYH
jgi:hypothetical protein